MRDWGFAQPARPSLCSNARTIKLQWLQLSLLDRKQVSTLARNYLTLRRMFDQVAVVGFPVGRGDVGYR